MLALYRKYRPKTFADVLGQEHTVTILQNTARQDKFAHAYLFYGPRGTGKTTVARLLAKVANCQKRQSDSTFAKQGEPCNACAACSQIDSGQTLDVTEIDAASNRGIDEIRDLKENVKTFPSLLRFKVFIVDEVHMLTTPAFNALLKTLEEPPAHIIFVLATTEYEKVLPTIVSRTQRFHFRKLTLQEIQKKLAVIVAAEDIKAAPQALELLAYLADGSVRDAESLLDQIVSMRGGTVVIEDIEKILGKVDFLKTTAMADLLIAGDLASSLEFLHEVANEGYNLFQFNKDLTEHLRRALSLHLNPSLEKLYEREIARAQIAELEKHAKILKPEKVIALLKALIDAYTQMRYNPFPLVPFEIAIIENLKK